MFTVNTSVARTLARVSLRACGWPVGANITVGGEAATPLKNEYGARLFTPAGERVPIHPIGRGTINPDISL